MERKNAYNKEIGIRTSGPFLFIWLFANTISGITILYMQIWICGIMNRKCGGIHNGKAYVILLTGRN